MLALEDKQKLHEALRRRFATRDDVDDFIRGKLSENPENIAALRTPLRTTFWNLIDALEDAERIEELIDELRNISGTEVRRLLSNITFTPASARDARILYENGQPFVDRDDLHAKLLTLVMPKGKRILVVRGPRHHGNSHTRERIIQLSDRYGFRYADIRLQQYGLDVEIRPYDLGVAIAGALNLTMPKEVSDPKDSRWSVNFVNWLQGNLSLAQQFWIIIDDFEPEKIDVPHTVYEFIDLVASRMDGALAPLRLVLISYRHELPSNIKILVTREDLQFITDEDLAEYFIRFYLDYLECTETSVVAVDIAQRVRRTREKMGVGPKALERMRDAIIDECAELNLRAARG
jgi:DNA-directed RNA polymerase subunit F